MTNNHIFNNQLSIVKITKMSKKHDKKILANQELDDSSTNTSNEPEPEIQIPGWADFIRRELKYSDAPNYHRDLILGVIADKLERIAKCQEYRVKIMESLNPADKR